MYNIDSECELVHTAISYSCQNRSLYQGNYLRMTHEQTYIIHKCFLDFGSIEAMPTMTVVIIDGNVYNL